MKREESVVKVGDNYLVAETDAHYYVEGHSRQNRLYRLIKLDVSQPMTRILERSVFIKEEDWGTFYQENRLIKVGTPECSVQYKN